MSVLPAPTVRLDDRFARELPELAVPWEAAQAPEPRLLALDEALAADLGLDAGWLRSDDGLRFLVGALVPEGARPVAQAYAGHQFGAFVPRLGDGRALLLGELTTPDGSRRDLHLKGSGRNPFAHLDLAAEGLEAWTVPEVWVMAGGGGPVNRWVDVTDTFDRKLAALRAHVSQTAHMDDLEGMLRGWLGANAVSAGLADGRLAEGFRIVSTK